MKIALITDTHAGARNDSHIFTEYFISFFEEKFIPYLVDNNIDTVIHLGDVFDRRKYVNFRTWNQWRTRVFDLFSEKGIKLHIILGNHDVYYKNTNTVSSVVELLRAYEKDNITIYDKPLTVDFDGLPILMLPWINSENHAESMEAIDNTNAEVAMGHLELKGFEMFRGHFNYDKGLDVSLFKKFDLVFSGHFHHKSSMGGTCYLGNPYECIWSDWGDSRGFYIFDTETRQKVFIENDRKIFHKLYYNDEKETLEKLLEQDFTKYHNMYVKVIVSNKTNPYWFDQFIEAIYKENPADLSIIESSLDDDGLDDDDDMEGKDTLSLLTEFVDNMKLNNKEDIINLLRELYVEAASMDRD